MRDMAGSAPPVIALIGNPNTGKSTLFNRLTGLHQQVGNYPGVTVERHTGMATIDGKACALIDLPGAYSLSAHSPDEAVAIDVLMGRMDNEKQPDAVLIIADATNLRRNLYLATQIIELGMPTLLALNMADQLEQQGQSQDLETLSAVLKIPVMAISASTGQGLEDLQKKLAQIVQQRSHQPVTLCPQIAAAADQLHTEFQEQGDLLTAYDFERALVDEGGQSEERLALSIGDSVRSRLAAVRSSLSPEQPLYATEAEQRYAWIDNLLDQVSVSAGDRDTGITSWLDRLSSHPLIGSLMFVIMMGLVFQSVFAWATPLMDGIDTIQGSLAGWVGAQLPEGALSSLITDGVIAGVGAVVIFLPQILILFAFIIVLEDSGYMARAAFLMDRLMRWCGLSGQSFIPMLSSFACAVPGIMGTRVIANPRDRLATILAAPFMTCSARLPVYALLIAAFVPRQGVFFGLLNLQGLVLLGLYLLGIAGGILTAWLLKRTLLRGETPTFLMEMPRYRMPNLRSVLIKLWQRGQIFLTRAGTIIFTVAVVIWALAYFPRADGLEQQYEQQSYLLEQSLSGELLDSRLTQLDNELAAQQLEQSILGRIGHTIEPLFRPLGWDWKLSAAVVASFPAREVVIAVLGTIYAVGAEEGSEDGLIERMQAARQPDGSPMFTLPLVFGIMLFYAFCLQCVATIATIRRETNSWRWPAFAWFYMTGLGYFSALLVYQAGS